MRKAREEAVQMQRDVQNQLEAETQANQDLQVIIVILPLTCTLAVKLIETVSSAHLT